MKKIFILLAASLLFIMVGCVEGLHESDLSETSLEQLPDLTAGFVEGETKTYVESGKYLRWHEDDRLTAFYGNTLNRQYKFNGATGANSGSFSYVSSGNLETGNALDRIYAVYPYDETATITDDGQISLTLPAVQTYAENSFGRGANTMLAVTENLEDTFLPFKNVCGYLKLKLYNSDGATIKSIEVKGNGEEKIAGVATATIAFAGTPQLTMADDATTTITLDCGDGVTLGTTTEAATEFWVVIPETTFENGITITVTDTEGGIFEKSTTKEVAIERNAVQPMAALGVEFVAPVAKPANNEIWYTATAKEEPYNTDVFGANIESNEWDEATGEGVITFDGEVTTIGDSAFQNCSSLTSVIFPDSVTSIEPLAFCDCSSLTSITIPDSVTSIGNMAFNNCTSLTSIKIPDSVTSIGKAALSGCISLTSVNIDNGVTSIGDLAFYDCKSLTNVTIPNSVTSIGKSAFCYCESITSITIPDVVTTIGEATFYGCNNLTSVTIPNGVTEIGDYAFYYCNNLTSVTIPNRVTEIGDYAFRGCNKLASVTIGEGVKKIGFQAFADCTSLTRVTIPNSVTAIGESAFVSCTSLQEFRGKFASGDRRCLIIDGVLNSFAPAWLTIYTIPDSVTSIGKSAFSDCESLTGVTIPNSVTKINDYAFYNCSNLTSVYCEAITPPSLGIRVFQHIVLGYHEMIGCDIYVPAEAVYDYESASDWGSHDIVGYVFKKNEIWYTATAKIELYDSSDFGVYIKSHEWNSRTGKGVITFSGEITKIGANAFRACKNLTSIIIPNSVTSIGGHAFAYCESMTSIIIPNSVTSFGYSAFYKCSNLTSVTIPDCVTTIEDSTFKECSSLTSVTIPNRVTMIGSYAFKDCSSLTSVYCKATTPPIGYQIFANNASDRKIYVPSKSVNTYYFASGWIDYAAYIVGYDFENGQIVSDAPVAPAKNEIWYTATGKVEPYKTDAFGANIVSNDWNMATGEGVITFDGEVTTIGNNAFDYCGYTSLRSVTIPDSVTSIGHGAFSSCINLLYVTIPDSVNKIGDSAFRECRSLTNVCCKAITPPSLGNWVFQYYEYDTEYPEYCNLNCRIYVPAESVVAYKSATNWSDYASIVGYNF